MEGKEKKQFRYLSKDDVEMIKKLNNSHFTPEKIEELRAVKTPRPNELDKETFYCLSQRKVADIITDYRMVSYAEGFLCAVRLYSSMLKNQEISKSEEDLLCEKT